MRTSKPIEPDPVSTGGGSGRVRGYPAWGFLFAALTRVPAAKASDTGDKLDEIVVTATLRSVSLEELPGSASVLTGTTLRDAGQEHFEDVLPLVPNLNWAGDTSRPRYFQIRGIGQLQQYQV